MQIKEVTDIKGLVINSMFIIFFWSLSILLTILTGKIFFLINFGYIGTFLGLGLILYVIFPRNKKHIARKISQFTIGIYLFVFLGIFARMNIQIEGFWFEILFGVFTAPFIHYLVAKVFGTLFIGRIYCGWGCWTAMVLDILPYGKSKGRIKGNWGSFRYLNFTISFIIVILSWFVFGYNQFEYFKSAIDAGKTAYISAYSLVWFLSGNLIYFTAGIILAFLLKDNRAFCKYICPITAFLKIFSRFSLVKMKCDESKCNSCLLCEKNCPMNIRINDYTIAGKRILSTECILCLKCKDTCPKGAIKLSAGFDCGFKEYLIFKE